LNDRAGSKTGQDAAARMALRLATFNLKDFFSPRVEGERAVVEAKVANVAANLREAVQDGSS
jgi:hypothetical protein